MLEGEGTGEGTGTGAGTGESTPAWVAQLPADLKGETTFTTHKTLGDFAKAHLEKLGKVTELEGKAAKASELEAKLSGAIFKPADDATPEQLEAFYRSLGKPETPKDYEFPKGEGVEHDPKLTEWAQSTFHAANLNKEQAKVIGGAWDKFIGEMVKANQEAVVKARTEAETAIKTELGEQYPVAVQLTSRFIEKYAKPEEKAFLDESGMGNHPTFVRMVFAFAKKTGEDVSVQGSGGKGDPPKIGMNYTTMGDFAKGG